MLNRLIVALFFCVLLGPTLALAVPELPRAYIDTTFPTQAGTVVVVPTGTNAVVNGLAFQAAIDAAKPGDTIVLTAGAQYQGNFALRSKAEMSNNSWILITSGRASELPPQGRRVQVTDRALMPELVSPNVAPVFQTQSGAAPTQGYWFTGVFITENSNYNYSPPSWYSWPNGTIIRFSYGLVQLGGSGVDQDTLAEVPSRFTFDRCYFYAGPTSHVKRAIQLDSAWTAVVDSRIEGMKGMGQDTQAVAGFNGPGPFKIVNNHLEGSGENVMFGGADPSIYGLVPSDIELRGNYLFKPPSWRGYWLVKNLFETKNNRRMLIEGNVLENNWPDGQTGWGIVLKTANQDGGCPLCVSEHITFRNNILKNSTSGVALHAADDYAAGGFIAQNTVNFENNILIDIGQSELGSLFQITGGPTPRTQTGMVIKHNTGILTTDHMYPKAFIFDGGKYVTDGLRIQDNLFGFFTATGLGSANAFSGSGTYSGRDSLDTFNTNWSTVGNVAINYLDYQPVAGFNYVPNRISDYVDVPARNFRINSASPLKGTASDGTDPGANWDQVIAATSGAVTGVWSPCAATAWLPSVTGLCGSVSQTSNCGTSRVTAGGLVCTTGQACVSTVCVTQLRIGDRNSDGRVDAADMAIVIAALGQVGSSEDLNGDGAVNIFDLVLVGRNWG